MRLQEPLARNAGIALLDAGIAEHRQHAADLRPVAVEKMHGVLDDQVLRNGVRRDGGGEREQAGRGAHRGGGWSGIVRVTLSWGSRGRGGRHNFV
jgi:hypothetical protein